MSSKRPSKLADAIPDVIGAYPQSAEEDFYPNPNANLDHISVYYTASDLAYISCTHCHHSSNQHKHVGQIHVLGLDRDVIACASCSKLFDYVPDSLKAYIDEVRSACNTDNITFTRAIAKNDQNSTLDQKFDEISNTLTDLVQDLRLKLEQQGQEIDKLKTDPLRKIKETINAFDLK